MIQGILAVPYVTDIENFGTPTTLITKEPADGCERELRLSRSGGRFFFISADFCLMEMNQLIFSYDETIKTL